MDLLQRIANRFRMFEHARIGHQAKESEHARPREADGTGTVQLLIEPVARNRVLSERAHVRIDENIGVDQYHL